MITFLLTRPEHDITTHYLSNWCKEAISLAESKNIKVLDLNREKANRKEVESKIQTLLPKLIVLNEHGSEEIVTGHLNEPLIIAGINEKILKDRIVYAISCKSAKILGKKAVEEGALCYIGYDDDFIFVYELSKVTRPLEDDVAKLFLYPSLLLVKSLLKNNSIEQTLVRVKEEMRNNLIKAYNEENTINARYLWWNLKHMISHGNKSVSLN